MFERGIPTLALNLVMLLTFRPVGLGWNGGGILLDPSIQGQKVIAVWTQIQPIPLVVSNPVPIVIGQSIYLREDKRSPPIYKNIY